MRAATFFDRLFGLPSRTARIARDLGHAVRLYRTSWPNVLRRALLLASRHGFSPREALERGLFDPAVPDRALVATVSKSRMLKLQHRVNPRTLQFLTEDKAIFYVYCAALGLPIPRLFGVAARPAGFTAEGQPLVDADDWRAFAATLPDEFVVKPSRGAYGHGVRVFRRDGDGFVDSLRNRHRAAELSTAVRTDDRYEAFVIQERLRGYRDLDTLSATSSLQTVRIVTYVNDAGASQICLAFLRIITGEATVDNYGDGRTGNIMALVDPRDGTLEKACGLAPGGVGLVWYPRHPNTGAAFEGFALPYWDAACVLVQQAALLFLPMRTVGWDVALTPEGPRLVEGNIGWDPASDLVAATSRPEVARGMTELLARLEAASPPRARRS